MENHLLRTVGNDIVNSIISALVTEHCIQCDSVTTSNRNSILNKLPPTVSKALEKLMKYIINKNAEEFLKELYTATEKLQIELKKFDKKIEKNVIDTHIASFMTQLATEINPANAFQLVLLILYHKRCGKILHIPTRSISVVLEKLKIASTKKQFAKLEEYYERVVEFLKEKSVRESKGDTIIETIPAYQILSAELNNLKALAEI